MYIINNGDNDKLFTVNGIPYRKGLYEVFYSLESSTEKMTVGVRHIYNQQPIVSTSLPSQYSVNTNNYSDSGLATLVKDLSVVLGFNPDGTIVTSYIMPYINYTSDADFNVVTDSLNRARVQFLTLTGSSTNVHLPAINSCVGKIIFIINDGTSDSNIFCDPSDGNGVWEGGMLGPSTNLLKDTVIRIINDGIKFRVL